MLLSVCVCIGATTYMENSATVSPLVFKHVRFTTCTGKGYKFLQCICTDVEQWGITWLRMLSGKHGMDFETYGTVYDMLMLG